MEDFMRFIEGMDLQLNLTQMSFPPISPPGMHTHLITTNGSLYSLAYVAIRATSEIIVLRRAFSQMNAVAQLPQ